MNLGLSARAMAFRSMALHPEFYAGEREKFRQFQSTPHYRSAARRGRWFSRRSHGLGELTIDPTKPPPWYADLLKQGLTILQAERIAKINRDRLAQGLAPMTNAEIRSIAPAANVQVELPPDLKNALMIGGAALLLIIASRGRK